jgi:hypothetical protein
MRKRLWIIGIVLLAALGLAALVLHARRAAELTPALTGRNVPSVTIPLANRLDLIGEWRRVEAPEAGMADHWRKFSEAGKFEVCYGCVIHWGTYRFVDDTTLETREGHNGELNQWTVGKAQGKLVLVHQKTGWVEQFVRVPTGSLRP